MVVQLNQNVFQKWNLFHLFINQTENLEWLAKFLASGWKKLINPWDWKKWKIRLFIDNCRSHKNLPTMENITVEFLTPNTTLKLQPLDQGIIWSFKAEYCKEIFCEFKTISMHCVHVWIYTVQPCCSVAELHICLTKFAYRGFLKVMIFTIFICIISFFGVGRAGSCQGSH